MSCPILYAPTETDFENNGIGILNDAISCIVTEEANGEFELEMQYPISGYYYPAIVDRCIIKVKPNQDAKPQLFRVYSIAKLMTKAVRISAQHISYDLSGIPVSRFTAEDASSAMTGLLTNAVIDCPFVFRTDKATVAPFSVDVPGSIRSKLGGSTGSILDVYGGEFEFDNFNVILHVSRGRNRGVSIRYGKNLTDIRQDRNCSSVATGIYPYWVNAENGNTVELPEKIVRADGTYSFEKIKTLDISSVFQEEPTEEQIRTYTRSYIKSNNIGIPSVSMSVSFKQLEQSEEYKGMALLEKVSLFDTVNVEFPALGVSATAKAVKIVYNALLDRVENIAIGSVKAKISDTIAKQQQQISQAPTKNEMYRASAAATAWLTNGKGYKVERRDENGNTIDTLYMDTPDIETAVNVLRIGQSGLGFSRNGVNGPYYSAWTLDGTFDASWIKSGIMSSKDGKVQIDLSGGNEPKFNTGISTNGLTVRADDVGVANAFSMKAFGGSSEGWTSDFSMNSANGADIVRFTEIFSADYKDQIGVMASFKSQDDSNIVRIVSSKNEAYLGIVQQGAGEDYITVKGWIHYDKTKDESKAFVDVITAYTINGKKVSWKDNGDGTYTLIGR